MNCYKKKKASNDKMKQIFSLVKKEFVIDFRDASGIMSIFIYLIGILYATSLLFKGNFTPVSYSSVFLIIFVFTSIISTHRNFLKENADSGLFNYIYYSPEQFIAGKIIYGTLINLIMAFLLIGLFVIFNGSLFNNLNTFILTILGLSIGMGILLPLMGSISGKTQNHFALISILSFPLLLPMLILSAKLLINSIDGLPISMSVKYIVSLYFLDVIVLALSLIFFPQVWEE